ncbi:hypothetical protein [Streptomyces sp. CA-132043]|uniref:hypothetical protein n=1 Tax=Streptomyces sp. CA-132043 TaxID=3240048 RepID=UPI003D8DD221
MDLAAVLLPRAEEYGDIKGVPGARTHVEDGHVVLRVPDTSASVTLLGLDPEEWLRAVDVQDQQMTSYGMTPCHRDLPDRWHPAERPYRRPGRQGTAASAWLTSGLLRRAGLIRTLGVPLAVTGWMGHYERDGGERWIIDPSFAEGDGVTGHRRLTALLAAPGWGLPLAPVDEHCNCHLPPGYSDQCTIITAGLAEWPGVLEVRAIQRSGEPPEVDPGALPIALRGPTAPRPLRACLGRALAPNAVDRLYRMNRSTPSPAFAENHSTSSATHQCVALCRLSRYSAPVSPRAH